jgi:two-component sensor histidine kinase
MFVVLTVKSDLGATAMPLHSCSNVIACQPPSLLLVEEFTHRVLNEYTEAICTLGLAAAAAPDARSTRAINAAARVLHAHTEAHRALQAPLADSPIELASYLEDLCGRLVKAQLAAAGIRLTVCADEVWLEAGRCWRAGLMIAELVRNASRHGLRGGPGEIRVDVTAARGEVVCCVRDNGRALAGAGGGGRGRRLVETLAVELDGEVAWAFSAAGCCARVTFAAAPPAWGQGQGPRSPAGAGPRASGS